MPGMGPPPKRPEQRRRRNATVAMTQLPASGRKGKAPRWPLPADLRATTQLASAEQEQEILEARIESGIAEKSDPAKLARLDQRIALIKARLEAAEKMETALWRELWRTPQAVAWERLRWTREVAQYVRWKTLAELGDIDASKEARQLSDRLGLNPLAMLRLRWEVAADEVGEARAQKSTVRRLKAVDPQAATGS